MVRLLLLEDEASGLSTVFVWSRLREPMRVFGRVLRVRVRVLRSSASSGESSGSNEDGVLGVGRVFEREKERRLRVGLGTGRRGVAYVRSVEASVVR